MSAAAAGLDAESIRKTFGGVAALDNVSLHIAPGSIHGLCGENGAGKSTLIGVLGGMHASDAGRVTIDGAALPRASVHAAEAHGVIVIHQEPLAFPDLSAEDSIFVGHEPTRFDGWWLDRRSIRKQTAALLDQLGEHFDTTRRVGDLPPAQRQMVAIARALSRKCRYLILDEPTAALSAREARVLLETVRRLAMSGVGVLYVSHRLEEVLALTSMVSVLRDGRLVGSQPTAELTRPALIRMMVGREIREWSHAEEPQPSIARLQGSNEISAARKPAESRTPALEVRNLCRTGAFQEITLHVHAGEIVGLAGLIGAGRSELARAIAGVDPYSHDSGASRSGGNDPSPKRKRVGISEKGARSEEHPRARAWGSDSRDCTSGPVPPRGSVAVYGQYVRGGSVRAAIDAGVVLVPEDRRHEGLVLPLSIRDNLTLAVLRKLTRGGFLSKSRERPVVAKWMSDLGVRAASADAAAHTLSGGNQQKVLLGKWLAAEPRVLLLDEPTRGVDVGAKAEIYAHIRRLAANGLAVLLISSDLPEILALSDRVMVMREGRIAGELARQEITEEAVLALAVPESAIAVPTARGAA